MREKSLVYDSDRIRVVVQPYGAERVSYVKLYSGEGEIRLNFSKKYMPLEYLPHPV